MSIKIKEAKSYIVLLKLSLAYLKTVQILLILFLRRYTKSNCPCFFCFSRPKAKVNVKKFIGHYKTSKIYLWSI